MIKRWSGAGDAIDFEVVLITRSWSGVGAKIHNPEVEPQLKTSTAYDS